MRLASEGSGRMSIPGPDTIFRCQLDNGIIGLARENFSSPSVVILGRLQVGSLAVPRHQAGLAGFVKEMLMRGTARRDFATIHETIESVGASLHFDSDWHSTSFSGRCLAEDLPLLLDVLADCLRHPTFLPQQVEKVRGEIMTALEQRDYDTRRMAVLTFYETLYEGHPLGISGLGYRDTISALAHEDLRAFYERYYRPQGMIVTLVGAVRAGEAIAALEGVLGDWQAERQAPQVVVAPVVRPTTIRRREVTIPGKSQADFVLGYVGLPRTHPDHLRARLADTILGVFGIMGRIGENVRNQQGLAYYAYSHLTATFSPGPWMAIAGVHPKNVERAVESILAEMRHLRDELVPAEEMADNKAFLTGFVPLSLETNGGVAGNLEAMEAYDLGLDYLQRYPSLIESITEQDVQRVAQTYLDPNAYTLAVARPEID